MVNFGPLTAEIGSRLGRLGHPCKLQRVSRLGSVTSRHSNSGRQANFAAPPIFDSRGGFGGQGVKLSNKDIVEIEGLRDVAMAINFGTKIATSGFV